MGVNWLDLQLPQEVLDLEAANKRLEEMETDMAAMETDRAAMKTNMAAMETNMQVLIDLLKRKGATDDEIQACLAGASA